MAVSRVVVLNLTEDQIRIEAVRQLHILDTESEPEFDEVVQFVGGLCETPYVVLTMVDTDRLWFKSQIGLNICEVRREISMCNHTLEKDNKLEIEDARVHPVFKDNPLVNSELNIRFYTGIPLRIDGAPLGIEGTVSIGTLCVLDDKPKVLTNTQKNGLKLMAKQVEHLLESRRNKILAENEAQKTQILAKKFTSLYNSIDDGVVENTVPDGRFSDCNNAFAEMLGYRREELLNMSLFDITPKSLHLFSKEKLKDVLALAGETETFEKQYLHKDGHTVPALVKVFKMQTAPGSPIKVWAQIKDLSQQKQKEQREAQRKKMESLGTLSGGIAHDFNNILAIMSGSAELIRMESATLSGDTSLAINRYLDKITDGAKRGADLVNRILAFSHKSRKISKPLDFKSAINQSLRLIKPTIPTSINLHTNLAETGIILAEPTNITQILINLFSNACQAIEPESGNITLSLMLSSSEQNLIELSLSDDGIGMDHSQLSQIFDPFYTTKDKGTGTGLGLAIVHGLVDEMSGSICVESQPNLGSKFRMRFPVITHANQEEKAKASSPPENPTTCNAKILVVEDEKDIAQLYKEYLECGGFNVHIEYDGLKGLEVLENAREPFDILVTDDQMPGMRGLELASYLRQRTPDTPIMMLTGFVSSMVENALDNGQIDACLTKPVSLKELLSKINELLSRKAGDVPIIM